MYRVDGTTVWFENNPEHMLLPEFSRFWLGLFVNFDRDQLPTQDYVDEYQKTDQTHLSTAEKKLLFLLIAEYTVYFDAYVRAALIVDQLDPDTTPTNEPEQLMVQVLQELINQDSRFARLSPLALRTWWAVRDVRQSNDENHEQRLAQFERDEQKLKRDEIHRGRSGFFRNKNP